MTDRDRFRIDIDPFDPGFIADPFPAYHQMQERGGVGWFERGKGFWLVTRHDLVRHVVTHPELFSSQSGPLATTVPSPELVARMAEIAPNGRPGEVPTLLTLDPPAHTRNRRLISRAFTPASVGRYEEATREICRSLIAAFPVGGEMDFVESFAVPLPVRVIARALDVPDDRVADFKRWSDASVAAIGADLTDEEKLEDLREMLELGAFVAEQIERKRQAGPAPDIMSQLVHARLTADESSELGETRDQLSDEEIQSIVRQLLVAGNETTTNLLTQLTILLAGEKELWARMGEDPSLVPSVIEEGLRYFSPSAVNQRVARDDTPLGDATIPAGDIVLVGYLASDHDPETFESPETFDPSRPNLGDHLAFGRGVHFCPGASLARMEARVALEELTAALDGYELPDTSPLAWNRSFQLRAVKQLPFRPLPAP